MTSNSRHGLPAATHGAPAYPLRDRTGIQAESFPRNPYRPPVDHEMPNHIERRPEHPGAARQRPPAAPGRPGRAASWPLASTDSLRRCRTARMVSRQHLSPKRSRTQWTRRRKVQRGAGSAPSRGGVAAVRWAAQTTSPSSASRHGQKGRRPPVRRNVSARGRPGYRRAPTASPCEPAGPCAPPPGWRSGAG